MKTLWLLLLLLCPLSAFAQSTPQFPFSQPQPRQGEMVVPNGYGGYHHQRVPGGLDAYSGMTMEQGLREMAKPTPQPSYQPPPLPYPFYHPPTPRPY